MGLGGYFVTSPGLCFSTEDYNEWMNKQYPNSDDDEKIIPNCFFYLIVMNVRNREFVNNICSHHRTHRLLVTSDYCQKDFKTFNDREVRCSSCRWSIKCNLKTLTFEKLKN